MKKYIVKTSRTDKTFNTEEEAFEYAKNNKSKKGCIVGILGESKPLYRMENGIITYQY